MFGFVKKAVKSVTHAVSDTVKGAAKIAGKVFSSKIFNIATTAMCFIPGLNAYGAIGKALAVLGKAQTIQNWIKTGFNVFNAIKDGKGITEAVKNLIGGKFQPLGRLGGLFGSGGGFLGGAAKAVQAFQERTKVLKQLQQFAGQIESMKQLSPVGIAENFEGLQSEFIKNIANHFSRIQSAVRMMQELQILSTPNPMLSSEYAVRC